MSECWYEAAEKRHEQGRCGAEQDCPLVERELVKPRYVRRGSPDERYGAERLNEPGGRARNDEQTRLAHELHYDSSARGAE